MRVRLLAVCVALVTPAFAGCLEWGDDDEPYRPPPGATSGTRLPPATPWAGPNLTLGGQVVDAATGFPLANATVTASLVTRSDGCGSGLLLPWQGWELDVADDGAFGPRDVPQPPSNASVIVFTARAPGYVTTRAEAPARAGATEDVPLRLPAATTLRFADESGTLVLWKPNGTADAAEWAVLGDGAHVVAGVAAGAYNVLFVNATGAPSPVSVDAPAFAAADAAPAGYDAEDAPHPHVTGLVLGNASAGALVIAYDGHHAPAGAARADDSGAFNVTLPSTGTYRLATWPSGPADGIGMTVNATRGLPDPYVELQPPMDGECADA